MRPRVAIAVANIFILLGFVAFISALLPWVLFGTTPNAVLATVVAAVFWSIALILGGLGGRSRSSKPRFHGDTVRANETLEEEYAHEDRLDEQRAAREIDSPRHQPPPD